MAVEQTLSIIKPDGVQKNLIGEIYSRFEKAGLEIVAARMMHLTEEQAQGFYAVHKERPFFNDLVSYMTSGPVVVQVLQGDGAIAKNREIMGATNPADADPGTIRADFAAEHRREHRARLGRRGDGRGRDCILLRRRRRLPADALGDA